MSIGFRDSVTIVWNSTILKTRKVNRCIIGKSISLLIVWKVSICCHISAHTSDGITTYILTH